MSGIIFSTESWNILISTQTMSDTLTVKNYFDVRGVLMLKTIMAASISLLFFSTAAEAGSWVWYTADGVLVSKVCRMRGGGEFWYHDGRYGPVGSDCLITLDGKISAAGRIVRSLSTEGKLSASCRSNVGISYNFYDGTSGVIGQPCEFKINNTKLTGVFTELENN